DNWHLAIVPAGTEAVKRKVDVDGKGKFEERNVLILDEGKDFHKRKDADDNEYVVQPEIFVTRYKTLGSIYVIILLIIITITSVTIRGLWTVFVFVTLIMLTIILAAGGWWEIIFHR